MINLKLSQNIFINFILFFHYKVYSTHEINITMIFNDKKLYNLFVGELLDEYCIDFSDWIIIKAILSKYGMVKQVISQVKLLRYLRLSSL